MKIRIIIITFIFLINKSFGQIKEFDNIKPINIEGLNLFFASKENRYGIINSSNEIIIPLEFSLITICTDLDNSDIKFVVAKKDNKSMIVSLKTGKILSKKYDEVNCFSKEGYAIVKQQNKYGVINNKFEEVVSIKYDLLFIPNFINPPFSILGVGLNKKYGFIDLKDNIIIPIKYDWVNNYFSDNLVGVELNGKFGFVHKNGNEVIYPKYDEIIKGFDFGKSLVTLDNQFISLDTIGNPTITKDPIETVPLQINNKGVVINGVRWATSNVDETGKFASSPQSIGKLYRWNSKKSFEKRDIINKNLDSNNNDLIISNWDIKNDPSPKGWRIPTYEEIKTLLDERKVESIQTIQNGISGRLFIDIETKDSIFFPNIPQKYSNYYQKLIDTDKEGYYWSNTMKQDGVVYTLFIRSNFLWRVLNAGESSIKNSDFYDAFSIRPVSINQK